MRSYIFVLMLLLLSPGVALAGNPMTREVARKHYELGETLYQTSSYGAALAEFEKAYALEPLPELLFNIARCHEVLANLEQAIKNYEAYLEKKPGADNRPLVEARLKNLRKRLAEASSKVKPEQNPVPPSGKPVPEPSDPRSWMKITGWTAVGVGAASLGLGVIFGALGGSKDEEFDTASGENRPYGELTEIDDAGQSYNIAMAVSMITGGVLAAAGAGILLGYYMGGD